MNFEMSDLNNVLKISKSIEYRKDKIVIFKDGKEFELSSKQLFSLLKKLSFYLEIDEKCIDKDGPLASVVRKSSSL